MNFSFTFKVVTIYLFTLFSVAKAHTQGQETWGGDILALNFVKMARIMSIELTTNDNCKSAFPVSIEKWADIIEKTTVESVGKTRPSTAGHILINRYTYWDLRLDWKIEKLLGEYFSQIGLHLDADIISSIGKKCKTSDYWAAVLRPSQAQQNPKAIEQEIADLSIELNQQLRSGGMRSIENNFDHKDFETIANELATLPKLSQKLKWNPSPISFIFPDDTFKDAQNNVQRKTFSLGLNASHWRLLSRGQKRELLFHEILGLMRKDDHLYTNSSRLLFTLPISEYK